MGAVRETGFLQKMLLTFFCTPKVWDKAVLSERGIQIVCVELKIEPIEFAFEYQAIIRNL
jgi:hypothetical protein